VQGTDKTLWALPDCVTVSPATCCTEGRACNTCWFDENGPKCSNNKPPDDDNCVSTFLDDTHNGPVACPDECAFQASVQRDCVKLGEPMINGTHSHGEHDLCHIVHPGTYAFIGATCMLGGMTRMTVSLCVILMETTNNIQYLLPIMLTLSLSKWVGDIFNISLYDMHVEIKCIPFLEFKPPVGMEQLHAQDLMSSPVVTVQEVESAENIVRMLEDNDHNGFPVLRRGTRKFVGMVLRSQLVVLLKLRAFCGPDGLRNPSRLTQIGEQGNDDQADCSWFGGVQVTSDDFATKLQSEVDQIAEIGLTGVPLAGKFIDMRECRAPRPAQHPELTLRDARPNHEPEAVLGRRGDVAGARVPALPRDGHPALARGEHRQRGGRHPHAQGAARRLHAGPLLAMCSAPRPRFASAGRNAHC